jgi:predicted metal-dependent phosphoesterase TrpH
MRKRLEPLLCELHAHTTWSDGSLSVRQVVDLHGRRGIDVLCITDHVVRDDDPWREVEGVDVRAVEETTWGRYLADIEREAARARATYGMLVVPGLELTFNDRDPHEAAHAVAIGLRTFVPLEDGIADAMQAADEQGAALVAAHPFERADEAESALRLTCGFAERPELRDLAHRFELFNRSNLFPWVAEAGLPAVAGGDFHSPPHLAGWRTLVPCEQREDALVSYLRSPRPVYLTRLEADHSRIAA